MTPEGQVLSDRREGGPLSGALVARLFASQWFAREIVLNRWVFHAAQPPLRRRGG